jgi:hypothetical protein
MTGLRNVGVFTQENVWLENSLSHLAQAMYMVVCFVYVSLIL